MEVGYRPQQVPVKLESWTFGCPSSLEKEAYSNKSLHAKKSDVI